MIKSFRTVDPKKEGGVVAYGTVQSRSDKKKSHTVVLRKDGNDKCQCMDQMFRDNPCDHILEVRKRFNVSRMRIVGRKIIQ